MNKGRKKAAAKKGKLTEKQKRFADFYIETGNQTESAKRAGYSAKTAYAIGNENLKKPDIRRYIDQRLKKLEEARIADATEVMQYLTSVMRREQHENVVVTLSEETTGYAPDSSGAMHKQTIKREVPQVVEIPAKLSDANRAAEMLAKRYQLFDGPGTGQSTEDRLTDYLSVLEDTVKHEPK